MPFKKRDEGNTDWEIEDFESYRPEPDLKYSHEALVMEQLRRAMKSLSQEMKKGYEERKQDRFGNIAAIKTYPDTRKESAECVTTLKNLMIGHVYDNKDVTKAIDDLFAKLTELKENYVKLEQEAWNKIPENIKKPGSNWADRWDHLPNTLNFDHIYGEKYLQESVDIYRELLEELVLLLHRMQYFKASKM